MHFDSLWIFWILLKQFLRVPHSSSDFFRAPQSSSELLRVPQSSLEFSDFLRVPQSSQSSSEFLRVPPSSSEHLKVPQSSSELLRSPQIFSEFLRNSTSVKTLTEKEREIWILKSWLSNMNSGRRYHHVTIIQHTIPRHSSLQLWFIKALFSNRCKKSAFHIQKCM